MSVCIWASLSETQGITGFAHWLVCTNSVLYILIWCYDRFMCTKHTWLSDSESHWQGRDSCVDTTGLLLFCSWNLRISHCLCYSRWLHGETCWSRSYKYCETERELFSQTVLRLCCCCKECSWFWRLFITFKRSHHSTS